MTDLESVATCPVCGSTKFNPHLTTKDFTVTGEEFNIVTCTRCQLGITNPRPNQESIGRYYESPRYISHSGGTASLIDRLYKIVRSYNAGKKLDLISRFATTPHILDYGCGTGHFLQSAIKRRWSGAGVEPSAEARKHISPNLEIHSNLQQVTTSFHVITLWHVLEHVHNLRDTLTDLRQRLKPGGIIFIAVPNHESFDALHYGKYWAGYDVPRHLWHFNKGSLTQLLESNHFRLLQILPMKFDAYYVSLLSESYKTNGRSPINTLRATTIGFRSNAAAGTDNHSSLIYIAQL